MTLQDRINDSVATALEQMSRDASWRCYSGPRQASLIDALCTLTGATHSGLASSGTAALEMLLRGCGLDSDDEVMLSGYDYPGNFAAIESVGARPVLVDVEPGSWRLDVEQLEPAYTPSCKVLIASHLHGQLQPMRVLQDWCQAHSVALIQDACQALGATVEGQPLAAWADATLLSFGGTKVISAGRGGAWVTRDARWALLTRRAAGVGSGTHEMSELQAAIVMAQLPFLEEVTCACRSYFTDQQIWLAARVPGLNAPWWDDRESSAFYQAGWILPPDVSIEELSAMTALPVSFGAGFAGFHRRSARRARINRVLANVETVVTRTVTMHHRSALQKPDAS